MSQATHWLSFANSKMVLPNSIFSMCVKVIMCFIINLVLNMEFTESEPVYT